MIFKKRIISYLALLLFFNCGSQNLELGNEINTISLTVFRSNENISPLVLFLETSSNKIIFFNIKLKTLPVPVPPDSINPTFAKQEKTFLKVIHLPDSEIKILEQELLRFNKNDFIDRYSFLDNGIGISLNIVYNNLEVRSITLINDSTDNHKRFFESLIKRIKKYSEDEKLIDQYFR